MTTPLPPAVPSGDTPPADPPKPTDPATPAGAVLPEPGVDFGEDLDKWKHFARQHEAEARRQRTAAESAQAELAKAQRASQSAAERALSDARSEGESAGESAAAEKYRSVIARHALNAAAAQNQKAVPEAAVGRMNLADLVSDDGTVDSDALKEIVSGFAPAAGAVPAAPPLPPPDPAQRGNRTQGRGGKPNPDDAMAAGADLYRAHFPKPN